MSGAQFIDRLAGAIDDVQAIVGGVTPVLVLGYPQILPPTSATRCLGLLGLSPPEASVAAESAFELSLAEVAGFEVDRRKLLVPLPHEVRVHPLGVNNVAAR